MEFSLREWLILIGIVIIVVILIDGFRRYKKGQEITQSEDDFDDYDDTLFRQDGDVISNKRQVSAPDPIDNAFEMARKTAKAPLAEVPHKVDAGPELKRNDDINLDELSHLVPERDFGDSAVSDQDYSDDGFYEQDDLDLGLEEDYQDSDYQNDDYHDDEVAESAQGDEDFERHYSEVDINQVTPMGELDEDEHIEDDTDVAEVEEIIVINILAPQEQNYAGMELLQLILNCGMRYGDMDIFHRHEDGFDRGRVQFSMANAMEPGTFDLDNMGETECPGVSFFMGLPGPKNSMKAFDFMLETAQTLVRHLGGELLDERRMPMSEQTIAHCRQRIRDFERRKLTRAK
ncbi:cell division protein ZipA [Marinomonas sp. C2222]|uniref:Cell division protein ZipA n=1 Tax=Marinomonas sargassi TaxID=2984494 RepID=A0ABT2YNE2_9GAMM|nr:cell division protein ZipA [Marinomonas sargassi]MCV2401356.1 cell division protein ZipA [Marinomonas sargassi]